MKRLKPESLFVWSRDGESCHSKSHVQKGSDLDCSNVLYCFVSFVVFRLKQTYIFEVDFLKMNCYIAKKGLVLSCLLHLSVLIHSAWFFDVGMLDKQGCWI